MKKILTEEQRIQHIKEAKKRYVENHPERRKISVNNYWKKKREENPELWKAQMREKSKNHRLKHLSNYQEMEKEKSRLLRVRDLEGVKRVHRNYLLAKYGLKEGTYQKILLSQTGKCAICKSDFSKKGPFIDHCHTDGKTRGIICSPCNFILGYFEKKLLENKNILEEFTIYLKTHNCWEKH